MEYIKKILKSKEFKKQFQNSESRFKQRILKVQYPFIKILNE